MDLDVVNGTEGIVDALRLAGHLTTEWGALAVVGVALLTWIARRVRWSPEYLFLLFRESARAGGASGAAFGVPSLLLDLVILPVEALLGLRRGPARAKLPDVLRTMETILDVAARANAKSDALAAAVRSRAQSIVEAEDALRDEARDLRRELDRHEKTLRGLIEFRAQFDESSPPAIETSTNDDALASTGTVQLAPGSTRIERIVRVKNQN